MFIMMPNAFASAHHENLPDESAVLEDRIQVGFADAIDIVAESAVGSYFAFVLMPAFEVVVVL